MFRQLFAILRERVSILVLVDKLLHSISSTKTQIGNSEGRDELPEDGTQLPKHVGAAK
jgi:hypothetical protein